MSLKKTKKTIVKSILFFTLMMFFLDKPVFAQDTTLDAEEVLEFTLEELMNMTVISASKKAEGLFDAPSVITTISAKEINDFGARNIYEVLERSTSFYGISSYFFPNNVMALRGDLPTHINPNILFLLDGRPVRESIKGGQAIGFLTTFPVSAIQRIELIRGPGSVLYGSNAYIGVVNIITKKGEEPQLYAEVNGGSMNTIKAEATYLGAIGELKYNASLNYYNTEGWDLADSLFFAGQSRFAENKMGQDVLATNVGLEYKGFTTNVFYGQNTLGKTHHTGAAADYDARRMFANLGYTKTITDWYTLSTDVTYNRINDVFWVDAPDGIAYEMSSDDMVYELTNFFKVNDKIEVTLGGSISTMSGSQYYGDNHSINEVIVSYPVDPYYFAWFSGYIQGDYRPTDWAKIVLGGQINKIPANDIDFVPRAAVILKSKKGYGTKIMYGQAFRAPYPGETDLKVGAVYGDPNLSPQIIGTLELQAFYEKEKGNIALTYFRSHQDDLISRTANTDASIPAGSVYTNAGVLDSWGLELEGKVSVSSDFYLLGSYSLQHSTANDTIDNPVLLPNHMLKLGASYDIQNMVQLSVFNSFYTSPYNYSDVYNTVKRTSIGELSAFNWLTAKAVVKMNKIFNIERPKINATIEGVNILNETVYNPEIVFKGFDAFRNRPGSAYYFGVQINL